MRIKIGIIFIVTGALIITGALYTRFETYQKQRIMIQNFNQEEYVFKQEDYEESQQLEVKKTKEFPQQEELPYDIIGILSIPKIEVTVAVVEGASDDTLKNAVGHIKDTANTGEIGNCAIAGHRSYTYNQFFNRLDEVELDDDIIIRTRRGTHKYSVYDRRIVYPDDKYILEDTKDSIITLITCHPVRSSEFRLVIKGKLVEQS